MIQPVQQTAVICDRPQIALIAFCDMVLSFRILYKERRDPFLFRKALHQNILFLKLRRIIRAAVGIQNRLQKFITICHAFLLSTAGDYHTEAAVFP